jgi:hypothetical protein
MRIEYWCETYLPILGISQEHGWIFSFTDLTTVIILHLLGVLLGLDAIIFGKGALVASSASVGEEVRSNWLDAALRGCGELANCLEILLSRPTLWKDREREIDVGVSSHLES